MVGLRKMSSHCGKKISAPEGFQPPVPKPLSIADGNYAGFLSGAIAAAARLGSGVFVLGWTPLVPAADKGPWPGTLGLLRDGSTLLSRCNRPKTPPIIYEYEASPFCRKVREACSILDLTVEYRPCPGARQGWSDEMSKLTGGKRTVPFMQDGDVAMFESDDIIRYLFENYGPGADYVPWTLKGDFARNSAAYAASVRGYAGSRLLANVRKDIQSLQPVTLWGYEGSPFVRPVREVLNQLGLQHIMVNCARGSSNRDELYKKTGLFQVPYLEDPNTGKSDCHISYFHMLRTDKQSLFVPCLSYIAGVQMFESSDIVKYLLATYTEK